MWKSLNYGEKVSTGDRLRYQPNSNSLVPVDQTYIVVRTDQHYFEIIPKTENVNAANPPDRKIVRHMDIGYNVKLERWDGSEKISHNSE